MSLSADTPVAELVTDQPGRARIFEELGIDYCCGGDHSLAEACRKNDLDPETVVRMLNATVQSGTSPSKDWTKASLGSLMDHIVETHHDYLRSELPRLEQLLSRVVQAHGTEVPWLDPTLEVFQTLKLDLETHMMSEEERVFPSIRALTTDGDAPETGLDENGIDKMIREHDDAGTALERLRDLTNGFTPPAGACPKFRAALDGLDELETDMHQHVHKENNILFPRARALA
ncbi:iron-sulfur cluster repair di-iron protein [Salinibacter sp. 10B]|uniref:iron-sulfur cluster repair di-iron protein n=1 Tax=Salinibacter sp. 10B TaxID=1923971 RepID=UPI000CF57E2B|nr:iron-sulfur cluster repair di-iron protein [Salinibacter sp. 10B]PQJ33688.1 iron-sulfur cluster repair di-iron protein [Salinibacter sp. 10B]